MTRSAPGCRHTFACIFSPSFMPQPTDLAARRALLARTLGAAGVLCAGLQPPALALRPRADSPDVAIDPLLVDTGLAGRWGAAMRRDLGWAARWQAATSRQVLDRLESGEVEVGLFLSHPRAAFLEKEGLIHDRRQLARTEVWLIGPADDPAGIRSEKDPARAIAQVLAARAAGVVGWQVGLPGDPAETVGPDSPLAQLAARLLALPTGAGPAGALGSKSSASAMGAPTYRLVTQAAWLRQGPAVQAGGGVSSTREPGRPSTRGQAGGTRVWFQGHPAMVLHAEVARSFRGRHPGGRLLVDWLDRPLARGTLRGAAGWQVVKG